MTNVIYALLCIPVALVVVWVILALCAVAARADAALMDADHQVRYE